MVPARLPEAQHFVLHPHAGKGVERAKWFVEEKNLGMIDQGARQGDPLGHAAREMVRDKHSRMLPTQPAA